MVAAMDQRERRRAPRVPLGVPVEFRGHAGNCRNVSARGIYFETRTVCDLAVDAELTVWLDVSQLPNASYIEGFVNSGRIRRIEAIETEPPRRAPTCWGVAVEFAKPMEAMMLATRQR